MDPAIAILALVCIVWGIAVTLDAIEVHPQPLVRRSRVWVAGVFALVWTFTLGRRSGGATPTEPEPEDSPESKRADAALIEYGADGKLDDIETELKRRRLRDERKTPTDAPDAVSAADRWRNL